MCVGRGHDHRVDAAYAVAPLDEGAAQRPEEDIAVGGAGARMLAKRVHAQHLLPRGRRAATVRRSHTHTVSIAVVVPAGGPSELAPALGGRAAAGSSAPSLESHATGGTSRRRRLQRWRSLQHRAVSAARRAVSAHAHRHRDCCQPIRRRCPHDGGCCCCILRRRSSRQALRKRPLPWRSLPRLRMRTTAASRPACGRPMQRSGSRRAGTCS